MAAMSGCSTLITSVQRWLKATLDHHPLPHAGIGCDRGQAVMSLQSGVTLTFVYIHFIIPGE